MASRKIFPEHVERKFEIFDWRNAGTILVHACGPEFGEISSVLSAFELRRSDISIGGSNKSPVARGIDEALYQLGWIEKKFDTRVIVDGVAAESPTHSVD
jgi:hypothetical protein